jgi:hypothetical protein
VEYGTDGEEEAEDQVQETPGYSGEDDDMEEGSVTEDEAVGSQAEEEAETAEASEVLEEEDAVDALAREEARRQGLTLVHIIAQLEQLQDTFMS